MPLIVRQTQHDDVDAILQIKQEPKVARHQYRVDIREYSDHIQRVLRGDNKTGVITSQFMTIAKDCEVIGYLRQDHYSVDGIKYLSCGWNLASAYWGQGVMRFALTQLLNQWIFELEIQHVFAEYFRTNLRCARLLDRLAFATQEIPIVERLSTAWQLRCLQWVVRRRLDAETWKLQDGSSISGTESTENLSVQGPNNPLQRTSRSTDSALTTLLADNGLSHQTKFAISTGPSPCCNLLTRRGR